MLPVLVTKLKRRLQIIAVLLSVIFALPNSAAIAEEAYKIPDDLIPVSQLKNGYTNEQALEFRRGYSPLNFVLNDDIGTFLLTHMSEILPTAVVLRDGPISKLKTKAMPQIADVVAKTDLGEISLRQAIEDPRSRIRGYIVVHKGKIVFEEYPGMQPNDIHLWYSSAKVITGLLIHILSEDGLLDLNKPITTYLPEFAGTDFEQCSVLNLLQHEAGMDFVETRATVTDPNHPVGRANAMLVAARGTKPGESLVSILKTVKASKKPGQAFDYSTFNTQLLKLVIESVTKKPWEDVVSERIWSVAGMEGALTSVVGGLVSCPVIGVPTSVGYGASFGGLSALLSMLNSCATGVAVVNIDNGFGAGPYIRSPALAHVHGAKRTYRSLRQ